MMKGFMRVSLVDRKNAYRGAAGENKFGTNMCAYCRDEREVLNAGHSIQECENRD